MPYRFVEVLTPSPVVQNQIVGEVPFELIYGTANQEKLNEYGRILGQEVSGISLNIDEIQVNDHKDLRRVIEAKAIASWEAAGRNSVIVEDDSFELFAWDRKPGVYISHFAKTENDKQILIDIANQSGDHRAVFKSAFAFFDGRQVQIYEAFTTGNIVTEKRGPFGFGFDDIFIPDGQEIFTEKDRRDRTFAEMSLEEKDRLSPRAKALIKIRDNPPKIGRWVFRLPEPYQMQLDGIRTEELHNEIALKHAFGLRSLGFQEINEDFRIEIEKLPPFYEVEIGSEIKSYLTDVNSADLGLIITPIDLAVDFNNKPLRLALNNNGRPIFYQMGPESTHMALTARAQEFLINHNPDTYEVIRKMLRGEITTAKRSNRRSPVIEKMLQIERKKLIESENAGLVGEVMVTQEIESSEDDVIITVSGTLATRELGYARASSDRVDLSRKVAANQGLLINSGGLPHSLFGLGGMPPVTGWRDVITTAALSYMDSYIPHNSTFVDAEKQTNLFLKAKNYIKSLALPKDIEEFVISHIGISVGSENPAEIAQQAKKWYDMGCRLIRIYTTNPGRGVIDTAEAIRNATEGVNSDLRLAVGPIVDMEQAKLLIGEKIKANILLAGHGGGENCTSLAGGGAATGLELLYLMSIDSAFNDTAIGLEGGTGDNIGALLGILDYISVDKRGVEGGIECGGLFAQHVNGIVVQPYHGSASSVTQWIESVVNPEVARKRLDAAGRLTNIEGKPGYSKKSKWVNSITDLFLERRRVAGTALADHGCISINELRERINEIGFPDHRQVTPPVSEIAGEHRSN